VEVEPPGDGSVDGRCTGGGNGVDGMIDGFGVGSVLCHLSPLLSFLAALTIGSRLYSESSSPQRKRESVSHEVRFIQNYCTIYGPIDVSMNGDGSERHCFPLFFVSLCVCSARLLLLSVLGTRTV
jgi:hypothetical protein